MIMALVLSLHVLDADTGRRVGDLTGFERVGGGPVGALVQLAGGLDESLQICSLIQLMPPEVREYTPGNPFCAHPFPNDTVPT